MIGGCNERIAGAAGSAQDELNGKQLVAAPFDRLDEVGPAPMREGAGSVQTFGSPSETLSHRTEVDDRFAL